MSDATRRRLAVPRTVGLKRVGVVGPFGVGIEAFLSWWREGRPCLAAPLSSLGDEGLPTDRACEVRDWRGRRHIPERKALKLMFPPVQFGVAASLEAWFGADAEGRGQDLEQATPEELRGMYVGAGQSVDEDWTFRESIAASVVDGVFDLQRFGVAGQDLVNPLWLVKGLSNNVLAFTAKMLALRGANDNFEAGAAGALIAVATAAEQIAGSKLDRALAGGADTLVTVEDLLGLARQGAFQGDGDFLPSQGAAFGLLVPGAAGDFGVLGWGSSSAPLCPDSLSRLDRVPGIEDACARASRRAREMAAVSQGRDRWAEPSLILRGPRLPGGEGDIPLSPSLGDAGAASGAWLLAAAWAARFVDGFSGNILLVAAGPNGETAALVLGTLP